MIVALHLRHFKIYKGIHFIPLSNGEKFCSLIGENGTGKSSILESIDFIINKRDVKEWPINNDAKAKGGIKGSNSPFITPTFLIKKDTLRQSTIEDAKHFKTAQRISKQLWDSTIKSTSKTSDGFNEYRNSLASRYSKDDYLLVMIGKRANEPGIYFGPIHYELGFFNSEGKHNEVELQKSFDGFYEYIISHYAYLYIPVETDAQMYTKLETQDMQKLMDKNIHKEIEKAITTKVLKGINIELNKFVEDIEATLESYQYKGKSKNSLTMPDLISKIIEAYFSIKVLNKKANDSPLVAVYDLSSGEKRKALIDVAYSFLVRNQERDKQIILAVDEPDASLHVSACYEQFSKLFELARLGHQIIITTHWYGYLPVISEGSATSMKKPLQMK
ncbi:AAA family ATPase [Hymenobacter cellulosilyticus]|uniref:ATP-binding protein n=1 Tax=Hymenobacter cellulosilyticus TaxID=2932248 RepID=A0A8T9Q5R6_9BACT|nr:AAA family ATPase [Hymenobacter cellulosilyticus]UOQ72877.1 ATP-binding protein [Hymenobacter cellulosilyticus]